ncbi:hypothetical protein FVE85_3634 [Porphyridium purpureum]|uniref:Glycosyltransferase 2-like domain-containing protein n=1 Tax=Porphyridium purpureum TaxID=35688 RepID=A0A5J4YL96_PORPP|nr:hypothetical protein FVE85_3634 [Porphyridium purpureum]|eukprot:POR5897..scf249_10
MDPRMFGRAQAAGASALYHADAQMAPQPQAQHSQRAAWSGGRLDGSYRGSPFPGASHTQAYPHAQHPASASMAPSEAYPAQGRVPDDLFQHIRAQAQAQPHPQSQVYSSAAAYPQQGRSPQQMLYDEQQRQQRLNHDVNLRRAMMSGPSLQIPPPQQLQPSSLSVSGLMPVRRAPASAASEQKASVQQYGYNDWTMGMNAGAVRSGLGANSGASTLAMPSLPKAPWNWWAALPQFMYISLIFIAMFFIFTEAPEFSGAVNTRSDAMSEKAQQVNSPAVISGKEQGAGMAADAGGLAAGASSRAAASAALRGSESTTQIPWLPPSASKVKTGQLATAETAKTGASLVAVCMNRQSVALQSLPTWLEVQGVDEIIVVDWSSDPPLEEVLGKLVEKDPRVHIVRVENEPHWVLSRAFNLGMSLVTRPIVLRVDCDYKLEPDLLEKHAVKADDRVFYSGNWRNAKNENEVHLNGMVIAPKAAVWKVMGYDERIQTYGWDDEDFYSRLEEAGYARQDIKYGSLHHVEHGDKARSQSGVRFVEVEVDYNRLMLEGLDKWTPAFLNDEKFEPSEYDVVSRNGPHLTLKSHRVPQRLSDIVGAEDAKKAWDLGLGRRLHDEYGLGWSVIQCMGTHAREVLLAELMLYEEEMKTLDDDNENKNAKPSILIMHVMHGLGNRMRALSSGMAFAKATRRGLLVVWEPDSHLQTSMDLLFNMSNVAVISSLKPKWPFTNEVQWDKAWEKVVSYNYMEAEGDGAVKGKKVVNRKGSVIYFKGAYVMESGYAGWTDENKAVKSLRPHDAVLAYMAQFDELDFSNMVGMHIRSRDLSHDIPGVDPVREYGEEQTRVLNEWRSKASVQAFARKLQSELQTNTAATFFVAADDKDIPLQLQEQFGSTRVFTLKRDCDSRALMCMRYAVADLYLLARTKEIWGSGWSSFTEAAVRLGREPKLLIAGEHFI